MLRVQSDNIITSKSKHTVKKLLFWYFRKSWFQLHVELFEWVFQLAAESFLFLISACLDLHPMEILWQCNWYWCSFSWCQETNHTTFDTSQILCKGTFCLHHLILIEVMYAAHTLLYDLSVNRVQDKGTSDDVFVTDNVSLFSWSRN